MQGFAESEFALRLIGGATRLGNDGATVGAHESCDIGAMGFEARNVFESSQYGIVEECAALDDDFIADGLGIAEFDDFVEGVFDDGIAQSCRDIADVSAFFLGLFHARIHEDGASRAQVDGIWCEEGFECERLRCMFERFGESLDKRSASRRASFVEHDAFDDAVVQDHALHILPTDIEDELDAWQERFCSAIVGNRLNFAFVDVEGFLDEPFAIARDAGVCDGDGRWEFAFNIA